jgi:hypothetical protein
MPHNQRISINVTLAGPQDTAVVAHRPGTDGAAVSVRVGSALLYVHDAATVQAFYRTWKQAARKARGLPINSDPTVVMSMAGRSEPAVMLDSAECPPRWSHFDVDRRRLNVCMGRIVFAVNDHEALRSTLWAFGRADRLAQATFSLPPPDPAQQAALAATRLLTPPEGARGPRQGRRAGADTAAAVHRPVAARAVVDGPSR